MIFKENSEFFGYNNSTSIWKQNFHKGLIQKIMNDNSFADRLNFALDKEGFPPKNKGRIQLLAEMVGLTHRGASKWINGETCPPAKKYEHLAKKLNVREAWLKSGLEPMQDSINSLENNDSSNVMNVPIYLTRDFFSESKEPMQTVSCNIPTIGSLFGIKLETEAMSPRFPKASLVIFDEKREAQDGDFVLISFDNYPAPIFRQLLIIGETTYLCAHNPKFDRLILTRKDKIYGVMIQAILSFV